MKTEIEKTYVVVWGGGDDTKESIPFDTKKEAKLFAALDTRRQHQRIERRMTRIDRDKEGKVMRKDENMKVVAVFKN